MVEIADFIQKRSYNKTGGGKASELYLAKIKEKDSKLLRLLEDRNSDIIKKYVPMHSYLEGIHSTPCININEDKGCLFCRELVDNLNTLYKDHFDWLYSLEYVDKQKTDEFNKEISKMDSKARKQKLVFKSGEVFEIEKTFDKEIVKMLDETEQKIHFSMLKTKKSIEMKKATSKFYAPVYDYATKEVKIFVFSPSVWTQLENSFTKLGYNFTSADFLITNNAVTGNYWGISKKDSSPITGEITEKYNTKKEQIITEIEKRTKLLNNEEQTKLYEFYKKTIQEKGEVVEVEEKQDAQQFQGNAVSEKKSEDLLSEIFS